MADRFCMVGANCGCGTNYCTTNLRNPNGVVALCPKCGMPHGNTHIGDGDVGATGRAVCPKCGLMQHGRVLGMVKRGYNVLRCRDCNQPNIVDDDGGTLDSCIRCGRIYDSRYAARHGNGSVASRLVRCPKCGGNVRTYAAT